MSALLFKSGALGGYGHTWTGDGWRIESFLQMAASGDWIRNPCTYEDRLATLKFTLACDAAIGG